MRILRRPIPAVGAAWWALAAFAWAQSGSAPPAQPEASPGPRLQDTDGFAATSRTCSTTSSRSTRTGSTWSGRRSCRRSRTSSERTAISTRACGRVRFGVRSWLPTGLGEIRTEFEFDLSGVGARTPDRRPFTCARRGASSDRFARARPSASSWTRTSSRTSLDYWGPNGMVNLPQRAAALDADRGARTSASFFALERPGGDRRQRRVRRPYRARRTSAGTSPYSGLHGALPHGGDPGDTFSSRERSATSAGSTRSRTRSTCRATRSAGA